jgi:hypothetical protein
MKVVVNLYCRFVRHFRSEGVCYDTDNISHGQRLASFALVQRDKWNWNRTEPVLQLTNWLLQLQGPDDHCPGTGSQRALCGN